MVRHFVALYDIPVIYRYFWSGETHALILGSHRHQARPPPARGAAHARRLNGTRALLPALRKGNPLCLMCTHSSSLFASIHHYVHWEAAHARRHIGPHARLPALRKGSTHFFSWGIAPLHEIQHGPTPPRHARTSTPPSQSHTTPKRSMSDSRRMLKTPPLLFETQLRRLPPL